jgi:hypothetical protein
MTVALQLRAGQALFSTIDPTAVVVIKAPAEPVTVSISGAEVTASKPESVPSGTPAGSGTRLGKRYADDAIGIELLVSKPGSGTLEVNGGPLDLKESKPLPASD